MARQWWQCLTACAVALGLTAPATAEVLYDRDGLRAERSPYDRSNPATGQRQSGYTYAVTFKGNKLCGKDMSTLLYPDQGFANFYCAGPVQAMADGMLVFFTGDKTALARVSVKQGQLSVQRIPMSRDSARDGLGETRFLHARMAGWSRISTAWYDTVLIRHAPWQVVYLGQGHLLDIAGDVAYLALPRRTETVQLEPGKWVELPNIGRTYDHGRSATYKVGATFRAVRWPGGQELARLDLDSCTDLPKLELNPGDATTAARVRYADVPAWRAATVSLAAGNKNGALRLLPGADLPRIANCTPEEPPVPARK